MEAEKLPFWVTSNACSMSCRYGITIIVGHGNAQVVANMWSINQNPVLTVRVVSNETVWENGL